MATRQKIAYTGDIGELEVLRELLVMGASVNTLTSSDYGWDLHVQPALEPMNANQVQDDGSWEMSGRTAHIQVKNMTSSQNPSVKGSTLRGWDYGSTVGAPTMVVVTKPSGKIYISPAGLRNCLASWNQSNARKIERGKKPAEKVTLTSNHARPFNSHVFPWILHLWTRYSGVLLVRNIDVDAWPYMDANARRARAYATVGLVYLAWMKSHFPDTPIPQKGEGGDVFSLEFSKEAWRVVRHLHPVPEEGNAEDRALNESALFMAFYEETMQSLFDAAQSIGVWPVAELTTSYAYATDAHEAAREAKQLIRDLMSYYVLCCNWKAGDSAGVQA